MPPTLRPRRPPSSQSQAVQQHNNSSKRTITLPDIEDFSPTEAVKIRYSLLQWYDANCRDLPWRHQNKPGENYSEEFQEQRAYAVWVSEVMLQQTRVAAVVGYFDRWMARWPTIKHLAEASQEEVNEVWAGLGYYRRAKYLLEGAKSIAQEGSFPRTAAALRRLPGIGEYTAGAIASIAFSEMVPVVDGNVVRVISRLKATSANPKEAATVKSFWKLAGQLVDPDRPGDFNQAIMELGALLCTQSSPSCSVCPVSEQCSALKLSKNGEKVKVTDYPAKVIKTKQRNDFAAVCVVEVAGDPDLRDEKHAFLLVKRPEEGLLAGLWEFPSVLLEDGKEDQVVRQKAIDKYLKKAFKLDVGNCRVNLRQDVGEYVHIFSHIRLHMYIELLVLSPKNALDLIHNEENGLARYKLVDQSLMLSLGLSSGVRKVYKMVQEFKQNRSIQLLKRARTRR